MVVLDVTFEMGPEIIDALGKDGNLNESGATVFVVLLEGLDDLLLFLFLNRHKNY